MLIVISAIASTIALFGALLVGYSTQQTIKGMTPKRDPNSVLVALPAEMEQELKQQQQFASSGVAVMQPAQEQQADQLAVNLRESIDRAAGRTADAPGKAAPELRDLAAALEGVLLEDTAAGEDIAVLRDYALRQLTAQDGTIVLPNYVPAALSAETGLSGELASQLAQLQSQLNQRVAALPELEGRDIALNTIELGNDPRQLEAAIEALGLQSDLLGIEFDESLRYESLHALGEELLGGNVNLDGLDLSELESISRELLGQLTEQDSAAANQLD